MGRGKKNEKNGEQQNLSQRDRIVLYRKTLHGEVAKAFDEVFYEEAGCDKSKGIRAALNKTSGNVHKAFTTAKATVDRLPKEVRDRDIQDEESEPDADDRKWESEKDYYDRMSTESVESEITDNLDPEN